MNQLKILYIHHAKDFSANAVYLSDDLRAANKSLFGAQEMDSWAGFRILAQSFPTYRLQISTNLSALQLILPTGQVIEPIKINVPKTLRDKLNRNYLKVIFEYLDPSFALFSDPKIRQTIEEIVSKYDISLIWSDTQFYVPALPSHIRLIIRSVNFEPSHVLREDPSPFRFLKAIGKSWSERKTLLKAEVVAISPRDASSYNKLTKQKVTHIPLRQLGFLLQQAPNWDYSSAPKFPPFFYFAGSSFDIKHNRDNLEYLVKEIAPALEKEHPEVLLLVFGHRFPDSLKLPSNVRRMYFSDDFFAHVQHSLGAIVPGRGGAGMQSKIFEPLCLGVPLIANKKAIAGYPFNPPSHFWRGDSLDEIISSTRLIIENSRNVAQVVHNSHSLGKNTFGLESLKEKIKELVRNDLN